MFGKEITRSLVVAVGKLGNQLDKHVAQIAWLNLIIN